MARVFRYKILDSTNSEAKRLAEIGQIEDIVVVAEQQTAGRGQKGRQWFSESSGGLYYTYLKKPHHFDFEKIPDYQHDIAQRVAKICTEISGQHVYVEWPNDLILTDKKMGGILLETSTGAASKKPRYVMMGIGLNLNQKQFPDDLKSSAVSLFQVSGKLYDKDLFISRLTEDLADVF